MAQNKLIGLIAAGLAALAIGGCERDNDTPNTPTPTVPAGPTEIPKPAEPTKKLLTKNSCESLDVMIMFDNTGSMKPYIDEAKQKGVGIINTIHLTYTDSRIAISTVADFGGGDTPYELKTGFTKDTAKIVQAINSIGLCGGGDEPEAYSHGLQMASNEAWRPDAYRLVVLIADSVAHDKLTLHKAVTSSNAKLAVLSPNEGNVSYWKSETPHVLPLASHENLGSLILRAVMLSCGDYPEVKYDTAQWKLSQNDKKELDALVKMIKKKKNLGIQVDGHTDSVGADFRNDVLGLRRAKSVAEYLNSQGVLTAAASYGEAKPLCTTGEDDCKALNRRSHLYPMMLTPTTSTFPAHVGDFTLAKIDGDNAVYSFIPTKRNHFGSKIAGMFNEADQTDTFRTVGYLTLSLDPDGNTPAGDNIRRFEPVYLNAQGK